MFTNKTTIDFSRFNKRNFIKLEFINLKNRVTCLICNGSIEIDTKDNFMPYKQIIKADKPGRPCSVSIKTNKQAFQRFTDEHKALCLNPVKER